MAIENLPRPWLLAALTGLKFSELLAPEAAEKGEHRLPDGAPRPEPRRHLRAVTAADRLGQSEPARCH